MKWHQWHHCRHWITISINGTMFVIIAIPAIDANDALVVIGLLQLSTRDHHCRYWCKSTNGVIGTFALKLRLLPSYHHWRHSNGTVSYKRWSPMAPISITIRDGVHHYCGVSHQVWFTIIVWLNLSCIVLRCAVCFFWVPTSTQLQQWTFNRDVRFFGDLFRTKNNFSWESGAFQCPGTITDRFLGRFKVKYE